MIFGIGTDLVELSRIKKTYERFGDHFVNRLLMDEELKLFKNVKNKTRFLAMRFAAKEAIVKAMGTGFSDGVWIKDTGVINLTSGKPITIYSHRGTNKLNTLGIEDILISLTDEANMILAFAVAIKK